MKGRNGMEVYLLDFLIGKRKASRIFHKEVLIEILKREYSVVDFTISDLIKVLKGLEKEGIVLFLNDKKHIKINPEFRKKIVDFIDIYGLVEGLPEFKVEFVYFDEAKLEITTPFRNINYDLIEFEVVKEDGKLYIKMSPYRLISLYIEKNFNEHYFEELRWRFNVEVGLKEYVPEKKILGNKKPFKIPYFRKETKPATFISDLYSIINAYLYKEGYLTKTVFQPVTKEDLITAIVCMESQYAYCDVGWKTLSEAEGDKASKEVEETLPDKLKDKTEEQLWEILEQRAKEIMSPDNNGIVDSMALSAYKEALMLLARKGKFKIEFKGGRRVIGKWK